MNAIAELFVGLLMAVTLLALLARRVKLPYPILFVIGGALISLLPGLPRFHLNPDVIFLFVLPPLLFPASLFTSWRDFRGNLRPILFLAVGLVLFTMASVAALAHYVMGFPWAAGFVLGAIVSPPDAIAATAIAEHLRIPRRIVTILEGESLVNDATALIALRFALAAMTTGTFSIAEASGQFVLVVIGGVVIGLGIAWLAGQFHKRVNEPAIEITFSLLTPFAAYLLAEKFEVSGVLAVVVAGIYLGWRTPEVLTFKTRLSGGPVWETIEFLLNGFVFISIGLELPEVLRELSVNSTSIARLISYALLISGTVIIMRIFWIFPATYLPRIFLKRHEGNDPAPKWQHVTIVSWTGMRGVVSLAAALALPLTLPNGDRFQGRELILFLTFVVIFVTLIFQGLTLPQLIRRLGVKDDGASEREEREARLKANRAALARLQRLEETEPAKADALSRLRIEYEDHIRQIEAASPESAGTPLRLFSSEYERLSFEALHVERHTIIELRNRDFINDEVLRRIQRDIDLAEARLANHQV